VPAVPAAFLGDPASRGRKRPGYDTLSVRRYQFVPFWGMLVFFLYARRRVHCPSCGVRAEALPWAEGKRRLTTTYAWLPAGWAKRLSWSEVAKAFHTTWDHVFESVKMAVEWGRQHVDLAGITAIGVDEMQWSRGHNYVTVVYQIDAGRRRLLWVGPKRTAKTLPSYLLRGGFEFFWDYVSPYWAGRFLNNWCRRVMRSRIEPMKKVALSLRSRRELILNWFQAQKEISAGVVEGLNNKAKPATRKAYGSRTYAALEVVLYHTLGNLPEPKCAHAFL